MITAQQKELLLNHLQKISPLRVGIFGSYARGENKPGSDLDVLVHLDYSKQISLLKLVRVEREISEALDIHVDLVTEKSLSPFIRPYIEKDLIYI